MKQQSQCDRVLAVLKDGRPHTMVEIHQEAGFMRLNSRISDLRHRLQLHGQTITCRRVGEHYVYQLVALDEPTVAIGEGLAAGSSSASSSNPSEAEFQPSCSATPSSEPQTHGRDGGGVLELFSCEIDESAGLKGAYWDDAA